MEYRNVAKIVLLNGKKEFLLQLRDDNPNIVHPGEWTFFGGGINLGEDSLKGLEREVSEEIPGCVIKDIQFIGEENLFFEEYSLSCHLIWFKGKIEGEIEDINRRLTEGQKAGYFKVEELDKLKMNLSTKKFIYQNIEKILL